MPVDKADRIIVDSAFEPKNAKDFFRKYLAILIEKLTQSVVDNGIDQPGVLMQSIGQFSKFVDDGKKVGLEISMEGYWKFLEHGVDGYQKSVGSEFKYKKNGKRIPIDALKKGFAAKGIVPAMSISRHRKSETFKDKRVRIRAKKVNKEDALDSFAFALGNKIKKEGLKPTHFYSEVVTDEFKANLKADLSKALARDIEINIKESFT